MRGLTVICASWQSVSFVAQASADRVAVGACGGVHPDVRAILILQLEVVLIHGLRRQRNELVLHRQRHLARSFRRCRQRTGRRGRGNPTVALFNTTSMVTVPPEGTLGNGRNDRCGALAAGWFDGRH